MPDIGSITDVQYSPTDPYFVSVDNAPLAALFYKIQVVNTQTDANANELINARNGYPNLAGYLATFALNATNVNNTLHNIGYHADGVGPDSISYVRMTYDERTKLSAIDPDSIIQIHVTTISTSTFQDVTFDNGTIYLEPSDTVQWTVDGDVGNQQLRAEMHFPPELAQIHIYECTPAPHTPSAPDWQTYSVPRAFIDSSLRIYVNGIRITEGGVYVPQSGGTGTWKFLSYTYDLEALTFTLSQPITSSDVVMIDFDISAS